MEKTGKIKNILIKNQILSEEQLDKYEKEAQKSRKNFTQYLLEKNIISSGPFYKLLAQHYNLKFTDLEEKNVKKEALMTLPEKIASVHRLIAFDKNKKAIKIATTKPDQMEIFDFIKKKTGLKPEIYVTTPENIDTYLKKYHKELKQELPAEAKDGEGEGVKNLNKALKNEAEEVSTIKLVDKIIEHAIYQEASDVHIEPEEKKIIVRYRIDGILHDVMTLNKSLENGIVARIKILANLKIDEHRMPQDGRFKAHSSKYKMSFRVSIIPTFYGEKIVMRLLNEGGRILNLEELGLQEESLEKIKRNIKKPHGKILVTGPTGSGKTTTLYTILDILNKPEVNISTIEDPIEYSIPRINQSQVNPKIGFTFAKGLRSFLRQDPDIIMVGEIRDKETAEIATHAALTGHLVLSTLHTNDTISTISRLSNMGIASYLISGTINLIIAQGLVRKICFNCIQSYNLSKKASEELDKQFNTKEIIESLRDKNMISEGEKKLEDVLFYKGRGCEKCGHTGYKGRIGVYEVLENTSKLANLILEQASEEKLKKQARQDGLVTMTEDGLIKARKGVTTIDEIIRVTQK